MVSRTPVGVGEPASRTALVGGIAVVLTMARNMAGLFGPAWPATGVTVSHGLELTTVALKLIAPPPPELNTTMGCSSISGLVTRAAKRRIEGAACNLGAAPATVNVMAASTGAVVPVA